MIQKEIIQDQDSVFRNVHKNWFDEDGTIMPGAFRSSDDSGVSVNWSKYSTPEESRNKAKTPSDNAVISLVAGEVRSIDSLRLEHTPISNNIAHSSIFGEMNPENRLSLLRISNIVLSFD